MKYRDQNLREMLAAEHVLGALTARTRARFLRSLKEDASLRRTVAEWETRLNPLAYALPEVEPPARVWNTIRQRIERPTEQSSGALGFWRSLALITTAAAAALLIYIGVAPRSEPAPYMVAVMSSPEPQPMMVATWPEKDEGKLKLTILSHHVMTADTSWELWCLPGGNQPPMSIGLVTTEPFQVVNLTADEMRALADAQGLALSVEPKGGSPTGAPTGPVLMSGELRKI
ncbi:MAG: anti-sigma factor [Burkholderiales bacterium]